jgi:radical SAM protein with 4Fe4S-binding SPASM domain
MMSGTLMDIRNFASTMTFQRIGNAWLNYTSFRHALRTKKAFHPGLPASISVEPTTSCNLRCPECPSGLRSFSRPTGMLNAGLFEKVIDELHEKLSYLILYFQGEPFLHPHFADLVAYASAHNIYTATSTNAHFLSEPNAVAIVKSGLKRIIVSIDGTDQQSYEKYRIGGNLKKVLAGVERLVEAKKALKSSSPYIILQFLLFKHNTHQIPAIRRLSRQLHVDKLELKTAQIYDYEKGSELIPTDEKLRRYRTDGKGRFHIKNPHFNKCWKMWHSCVMTWDGDIVPCCFDKDAKYTMGNIGQKSFHEVWTGERYHSFREQLLNNRHSIDICSNCTEGLNI